jgi:glycerophosphoryl diester phosphodiesterase
MDESGLSPEIFAHRAGFGPKETRGKDIYEQNSIPRAAETLETSPGLEIDVTFTKDKVAVVTHDNVNKITYEQFKTQYPSHGTLETWVNWFASNPDLKNKKLYLDLKGTDQDPLELVKLASQLGDRASISSKDPETVLGLLAARDLVIPDTSSPRNKIYLQIPDPIHPDISMGYVDNLYANLGINRQSAEVTGLAHLRPDGVHFYWPENLVKEIVTEVKRHGKITSSKKEARDLGISHLGNIPGLHRLQLERLKAFTAEAKKRGYEVVSGSTATAEVMAEMTKWGVDIIMPNIPTHLPDSIPPSPVTKNITLPEDLHQNTIKIAKGEPYPQDQLRTKYESLMSLVSVKIGFLRKQVGI